VGAAVVLVGSAVTTRHRAEAAADLAALAAAADAVTGSAGACATASSIAVANGAVLETCTLLPGAVVQIRVGVRGTMGPLGENWAHASARAGPVGP
jgi:secretion/DNA translocation related TadE-like protein